MIKRTLIAIALVALLTTLAHAELTLSGDKLFVGDHHAVKVDGSDYVRWPWEYKALDVCVIPVYMHVGMYAQVQDCKKKKVVLQQVDCGDIGKGGGDYPCYKGCVKFNVRANFEAVMGSYLTKKANDDEFKNPVKDWESWIKSGSPVPDDGNYHEVEACVKAWKTELYKATPGDEVEVGKLHITVKPNA